MKISIHAKYTKQCSCSTEVNKLRLIYFLFLIFYSILFIFILTLWCNCIGSGIPPKLPNSAWFFPYHYNSLCPQFHIWHWKLGDTVESWKLCFWVLLSLAITVTKRCISRQLFLLLLWLPCTLHGLRLPVVSCQTAAFMTDDRYLPVDLLDNCKNSVWP